jgi:hypothetical protein
MSCHKWQGLMRFSFFRYLVLLRQPENTELFEPCGELIQIENLKITDRNGGGLVEKSIILRCSTCGIIKKKKIFS